MRPRLWCAGLGAALLAAAALAAGATVAPRYYLALGDSLAVGVQPGPAASPGHASATANTRQGYADQLVARPRGPPPPPRPPPPPPGGPRARPPPTPGLRLVRAGCGGATTGSFVNGGPGLHPVPGCTPPRRLPYADDSPATSQLAWAERFLRRHGARVAYVTVDIGSNDLDGCASGGAIDLPCVERGTQQITGALPEIARRLRAAASPRTRIAGGTLYNPYLATWLDGPSGQAVAAAAQDLSDEINCTAIAPALERHGIAVARVDRAMRSDVPLARTTTVPGGGAAPVAVVAICAWTWMCAGPPAGPNIHPNATGYGRIAAAFAAALRGAR
ncbi:MAG: hypothetical protein IRZ32_13205 [Solirubrobacteraceae bacterium]|nr:hypothetical protein [Solirubrobacteraceae bacterium]